MDPTAFSETSLITPSGDGVFTGDVHPEWTIGGKPNGGYLLSMLGHAASAVGTHPHVIAASAHYLRSPDPGEVTVTAEVLRAGRSASQLRARIEQDDKVCVEALITTATLDPDVKPFWDKGLPAVGAVAQADCVRLPATGPSGITVSIMGQVDLRLEPTSLGFGVGKPRDLGELRGWLELPHGESFDPSSLLFAVDAFPPATFDIKVSGWVPTLELSVYVRALPAPGPVNILHRAHLIDADRVDESCHVWDSTGRLVAQSTQLAGIRFKP